MIPMLAHVILKGITMDRETFNNTLQMLTQRRPFRPFTVAMVNDDRVEVDFHNAIAFRDGTALYVAPGGFPAWFDHEGVNQVIGDLAGQSPV
jgi:hypothetical protein